MTLFPKMCETFLEESIIGRAIKSNSITVVCHNIREYTTNKHKRVDDYLYGGGKGMLIQPEPIDNCYNAICSTLNDKPYVIYMSPQGQKLDQKKSVEFSLKTSILIICGHYEGIDQRVIDKIVDEEISIGDYVVTGGELPALILVDSVVRLCDGVLSGPECYENESLFNGLLEHPQYTRPEIWEGKIVPSVLLSGHHKNIEDWKQKKRLETTKMKRPDIYELFLKNDE